MPVSLKHKKAAALEAVREYKPVVGVDIAPDSIRIVELERIGRDYHLRNFAMAATPEGCMEDGLITRPKEVGRLLKKMLKLGGFTTKSAVAAVRGSKVVSRLLTLPAMPQDRLRRVIETEVNRYVVFGKDDKVVFYHPLEEFDEDYRRKVAIMLVVADKALCNSYFQTLREAGLKCDALEMSTFSILRVLRNKMPSGVKAGSMMSVVYDYNGISMNVFSGETIRFSRFIRMPDLNPEHLNNGFMNKFMSEMLLALQYYQSEFPRGEPIRKVVLSLGATGGMNIMDKLSDEVGGVPVEVHAPFANIRIDVKEFSPELLEKVDFNFITAVGLALRGQESEPLPFRVDLLPADVADTREISSMLQSLAIPLLLVVMVFAALYVYNDQKLSKVKAANALLTSQTQQMQQELSGIINAGGSVQGMPVEAPAGQQMNISANMLRMLQQVVPGNIQLTGLELAEPDALTIDGIVEEATQQAAIDDLLSSMEKSGAFADAARGSENVIPASGSTQPQRAFTIKARYAPK